MGDHLINGEFQSDKYPTTPRGKVPLSCKDPTAQDLLWEYAQRRRVVDADFSDDLEAALRLQGYVPGSDEWRDISTAPKDGTLVSLKIAPGDDREHPLEDTAGASHTIGFNNLEHDDEDVWRFAGWCWSHDHFTAGEGTPTHWRPFLGRRAEA